MAEQESVILTNSVGTITNRSVKIRPAKGGSLTIDLVDILAINYQLKRKYLYAALCFLFGLGALIAGLIPTEGGRISIGSFIVPAVLFIAGMANLLGHYVLEIRTKKAAIRLEDVEFTKLKDGKQFIETLEKLIAEKNAN